ncbi:MAG: hypothetical protein EPO08_18160 [Rhodospirillaceae bacterium]|nr:MAG: hypothetical protein EPO08_18160 [Rhodospirillaceae bacterium]
MTVKFSGPARVCYSNSMTWDRCFIGVVGGVVITLLTVMGASAAPDSCPPYNTTIRVNFETHAPSPTYSNALNVTGIRDLFQTRGVAMAGPHTQALGVTFITPLFDLEGHTHFEARDGGFCLYFSEIDADFGYGDMDVYVASEYPPGSCEYRTVLDHENQHVAINTQVLREMAPQVRAELERLLTEEQPVFVLDSKSATREKLTDLSQRMKPILAAFQEVLAQRNGSIDTAQNYKTTSAVCRNWNRGNVWPQAKPADSSVRHE